MPLTTAASQMLGTPGMKHAATTCSKMWKYCQITGKAHAQVIQNLMVRLARVGQGHVIGICLMLCIWYLILKYHPSTSRMHAKVLQISFCIRLNMMMQSRGMLRYLRLRLDHCYHCRVCGIAETTCGNKHLRIDNDCLLLGLSGWAPRAWAIQTRRLLGLLCAQCHHLQPVDTCSGQARDLAVLCCPHIRVHHWDRRCLGC